MVNPVGGLAGADPENEFERSQLRDGVDWKVGVVNQPFRGSQSVSQVTHSCSRKLRLRNLSRVWWHGPFRPYGLEIRTNPRT